MENKCRAKKQMGSKAAIPIWLPEGRELARPPQDKGHSDQASGVPAAQVRRGLRDAPACALAAVAADAPSPPATSLDLQCPRSGGKPWSGPQLRVWPHRISRGAAPCASHPRALQLVRGTDPGWTLLGHRRPGWKASPRTRTGSLRGFWTPKAQPPLKLGRLLR